jgi:hypothetical protein
MATTDSLCRHLNNTPARGRLGLGEIPRKGRPYFERPLTVESLSELRSVLENAAHGSRDLVIALGAESTY